MKFGILGFLIGANPRLTRGRVKSRYQIENDAPQKSMQVNIGDELQSAETAAYETVLPLAEKKWDSLGQLSLMDVVVVYPLRDLHLQDYSDDLQHWPHLQSRACKHAVHRTLKKELGVRLLFNATSQYSAALRARCASSSSSATSTELSGHMMQRSRASLSSVAHAHMMRCKPWVTRSVMSWHGAPSSQ
jgi:hypothetical protein